MKDEAFDPSLLEWEFPLWTLVDTTIKRPLPYSIRSVNGGVLALFSDEDLAKAAIEAGSLHETIPGIISLPKDLHFILTEIRKYGGKNALMDISIVGGTFTGTPFSLDELIEALQKLSP